MTPAERVVWIGVLKALRSVVDKIQGLVDSKA